MIISLIWNQCATRENVTKFKQVYCITTVVDSLYEVSAFRTADAFQTELLFPFDISSLSDSKISEKE